MAGKKSYVDDDLMMLPFDFDEPSVSVVAAASPVTATATVDVREIIRTDFLGRDSSFVHQRKTGRLGWETVLPEGESFSSFVVDTSDEEAVLKNAYRIVKETLSAMDIPCKVSIRINNTETNCTDFKNVYVSTNMFDDKRLTCGQKTDIFTGIAIHEGCHLMYTDKDADKDVDDRFLHSILNVVEDERIERILGEDLPGYANFLKMTKYYLFDLYEKALDKEKLSDKKYIRLFNAILHLIRYPAALSDEDIDDFADELMAVREILSEWPASTAEALDRAREIYELFKKYLEDEKEEDEEDKGEPQPLTDDDIRQILDKISDVMGTLSHDGTKPLSEDDMSETVKSSPLIQELCEETVEHGVGNKAYILAPDQDPEVDDPKAEYLESLARVRKYVPAIKRILQSNASNLAFADKGTLNGKLDTDKLAEAVQGSRTVYFRQREVKASKIAVCILLDESGSMCCGYNGRTRISWAKDAAILLNEGLKDVPNVDLFIYGHSADMHGIGSTDIYTYRDHNEHGKYNLGYAAARSNNADGRAIREVAKRIRKQTGQQCLYFIVSDGAPAACAYTTTAGGVEDTRKAVQEVTKDGFFPIQVAIDPSVEPQEMFRDWVTLTDLAVLPKKLGAIIKKAVLKRSGRGGLAA